jgi:hypothetical protein
MKGKDITSRIRIFSLRIILASFGCIAIANATDAATTRKKIEADEAAIKTASVNAYSKAKANGCVKGAAVGGAAGLVAGHPLIGAVGGCLVNRHLHKSK